MIPTCPMTSAAVKAGKVDKLCYISCPSLLCKARLGVLLTVRELGELG